MRRWAWLLGVLLLFAGAHFALWRIACGRLRDGYDAWAAAQRAAGWTINTGQPAFGGWPLAAALNLPEVFVSAAPPTAPGELSWSTERLTLRVALLQPGTLQVLCTGPQRLRLGDATEIPYTADQLQLETPLAADAAGFSADLLATGLRIGVPLGHADGGGATGDPLAGFTIGLLKGHLAPVPAPAGAAPPLGFLLAAEAVGLPARAMPAVTDALGTRISSLSIEGDLVGALSNPADRPAPDPAAAARAWRDKGGALQLTRLALGWGPLGLSLVARLRLDAELQPVGTGDVHIIGYARALDALAASHAIGAHAALAGKALLGLIAAPAAHAAAGAANAVDLPLALRDRTLSVRNVPLLRLPGLDWASLDRD